MSKKQTKQFMFMKNRCKIKLTQLIIGGFFCIAPHLEARHSWLTSITSDGVTKPLSLGVHDVATEIRANGFQPMSATLSGGKINLVISLHNDPQTKEERAPYETMIWNFNQALYQATQSGHSLGEVRIFTRGEKSSACDIQWLQAGHPQANTGGIQSAGRVSFYDIFEPVFDPQNPISGSCRSFLENQVDGGYTLAHEWLHYFYGLYDEYCDKNGKYLSMNERPNSIMNLQSAWLDLSVKQYTDPPVGPQTRQGTAQHQRHNKSCWETLVDGAPVFAILNPLGFDWSEFQIKKGTIHYPALANFAPGSSFNPTPIPKNLGICPIPPIIKWMNPRPVIQIVLDKSGSMDSSLLANAKSAARNIVDKVELGTAIGIISFNESVSISHPITVVNSREDKVIIKNKINAITASGTTAIGNAARDALLGLKAFGIEDRTAAVYLLSDGQSNAGISPQSVIPDYLAAQVPIFGFAYGLAADPALSQMAVSTAGKSYASPTTLSDIKRAFLDAGALISDRPQSIQGEITSTSPLTDITMPFHVDPTMSNYQLDITYNGPASGASLVLVSPSGVIWNPEVVPELGNENSLCFAIDDPEPGEWTLSGTRNQNVRVVYSSDAKTLGSSYFLDAELVDNQDESGKIGVLAYLNYNQPINQANVTGTLTLAGEIVESVVFENVAPGIYCAEFSQPFSLDDTQAEIIVMANNNLGTAATTYEGISLALLPDGTAIEPPADTPLNANFTRTVALNIPVKARQADLYVNASRPDDSGNGKTLATAKKTIQAAIDIASAGNTIAVAPGVYAPIATINKRIRIESTGSREATIIDGGGINRCATLGTSSSHTNTVLSGFTLRNGNSKHVNVTVANGYGGASSYGTLHNCALSANTAENGGGSYYGVLRDCVFSGNTAATNGGGAYYSTLDSCALTENSASYGGGASSGTLNDCTLTGNVAEIMGGGSSGATLNNCLLKNNHVAGTSHTSGGGGSSYGILSNCVLSGNTATYGGGAYGGTLYDCTLTENSASSSGGGIYNMYTYSGMLYNCTLTKNSALANGGGASGCRMYNCILSENTADVGGGASSGTLYDCVLMDNIATRNGGGSSSGTLNNCVLSGNTAGINGGGASSGALNNCVLSDNISGASGGGASSGTLNNCVLSGNIAGTSGGGASSGTLNNCIIWENLAPNGSNYFNGTLKYSCATPLPDGIGNTAQNPLFVDAINGNFRLLTGSPCIDKGNNAYVIGGRDLDGNQRIHNSSVDMGVYEFGATLAIASVVYVDASRPNDSGDGRTWEAAKKTLQGAIDLAIDGDEILVANGVYASIRTAGKAIAIRSVNGANAAIIDGGGRNRCAQLTSNSSTIGNTVLTGFTLRNGYSDAGGGSYYGTLNNCVFTNNTASNYGGGSYHGTLNNCVFTSNTASNYYGGGSYGGTLNNCTLSGNTAGTNGGGSYSGTLNNCIIWNNSAPNGTNYSSGTIRYSCTTPLPSGTGNISQNPLFMNETAGNFRLKAGSPCIDAGNNTYAGNTVDMDGNQRIHAGTVDMGAYEYGAAAPSVTVPAAPTGIGASTMYADRVAISWTPVQGATSYKVYRGTSNSTSGAIMIQTISVASYNDTTAISGTTYYYWVKASNSADDSGFSVAAPGIRLAAPSAPAGLTASATHTDKVAVSWNPVVGATSYKIYRNTTNNSSGAIQIGTPFTPSYNDTTAIAGTSYYYWVKASNSAGDSAFSASAQGLRTVAIPSIPTGVSASTTYSDKVVVSWTVTSGATSYKVYRNTANNNSGAIQIGTPSTSPYNDITAIAGTMYYYWVKASNNAGDSAFSASAQGLRTVAIPSIPTGVSASTTYSDKVVVSWTATSGATSYKVYRNTSNNSSTATQIGTPATSPYNDTTAVAGTTYYYWVKASNNAAGDSAFSASAQGMRKHVSTTPTVNVVVDGPGTVTMSPANGQVINGKPVTLTAKPGKDALFVDWDTGDADASIKVAPAVDTVYVARFRLKSECADPEITDIVPAPNRMVGVPFAMQVNVNDTAKPVKYSATKLPPGLKFNAKTGLISGVPTKAGTYATTIKVGSVAWAKKQIVETIDITIEPLPTMAQGTFNGFFEDPETGGVGGSLTATVTAAGRITAKVVSTNGTWSFSAPSWTDRQNNLFAAEMRTTKGQTLSLEVDTSLAWNTWQMSGSANNAGTVFAQRYPFANARDPDYATALPILNTYKGYYTFALPGGDVLEVGEAENIPYGHGYLTATVDAKGKVKLSGKLADGTTLSGSSTLVILADKAVIPCHATLYKTGRCSGLLELDGNLAQGSVWQWLYPGKTPAGRAPAIADCFNMTLAPLGGKYGTLDSLADHYFNADATSVLVNDLDALDVSSVAFTLDARGNAILPKGKAPTFDKTEEAYIYNDDNPNVATFSVKPVTGLFSGKLNLYYEYYDARDALKLKTVSVSHAGVFIQSDAGPLGYGYYLQPDTWQSDDAKPVKYSLKRSFGVTIEK